MEGQLDEEFNCKICFEIMSTPVSLYCGHSFCKKCLIESLNIKPQCPMCRAITFIQPSTLNENISLKNIIQKHINKNKIEEQYNQNVQNQQEKPQDQQQAENLTNYFAIYAKGNPITYPGFFYEIELEQVKDIQALLDICQDRRFVLISKLKQAPYLSILAEIIEIKKSNNGQFKIAIQALQRIKVMKVDIVQGEDGVQTAIFVKGCDFYDKKDPQTDSTKIIFHKIRKMFTKKVKELYSQQNNYFQVLINQIHDKNLFHAILRKDIDMMEQNLEQVSWIFCRFFKFSKSLKQELFELQDQNARIMILWKQVSHFRDAGSFQQIFDINTPGQDHFSINGSLGIIIGALILLYLMKTYNLDL